MREHTHTVTRKSLSASSVRKVTCGALFAMIDAAKPCLDIAQQLSAVENTIVNAKRTLIRDHLDHCLEEAVGVLPGEQRRSIDDFKAITKTSTYIVLACATQGLS